MTVGSITEPTVTASPAAGCTCRADRLCAVTGCGLGAHPAGPPSIESLLTQPPFTPPKRHRRHPGAYDAAVGWMLDWLLDQPGDTWQDRWLASGADADGTVLAAHPGGVDGSARTRPVMDARLVFPSVVHRLRRRPHPPLAELACCSAIPARQPDQHHGPLPRPRRRSHRCKHCVRPTRTSHAAAATRTTYRASLILAAKGGAIADITVGDLLELLDAEAATLITAPGATHLFYRVLRTMNVFGSDAPATLRELRTLGQRTPEQLIDRYGLVCQPIRDLLVDYLKERQPALDYTSLDSLANFLGSLFWADLERHHPGIDTLHLPSEVAEGWKQRLRTVPKTVRAPDGARPRSRCRGSTTANASPPCGPSISTWLTGPSKTPAAGRPGWRPARLEAKRSTGEKTSGNANPAWTPAPVTDYRCCRRCDAPPIVVAKMPPRCLTPPATPRSDRPSPPPAAP